MKNDISAQTTVTVEFSQPTNFVASVDYGDGTGDLTYYIPDPTVAVCEITITNSTLPPNVKCEYYDGSSWININTTTGVFSQTLTNTSIESPYVWTYEIEIEPTADIMVWGPKLFKISPDGDFVDGDKTVFVIENYSNFGFETDFGTPPAPMFTNQPESVSLSPTGASFTNSFRAYNASIVDGNWQYSDNYDPLNPQSATWTNIDESSSGMSYNLSALVGDLVGIGSQDSMQLSYTSQIANLDVDISAYVYGRKYRYKCVAF